MVQVNELTYACVSGAEHDTFSIFKVRVLFH